jgi:prepilin-type N-terminal cleavage/methylation domain-containing protein
MGFERGVVMNRKGFTLLELILIIAILGILAVSALPKFLNLSTDAEQADRDGVVGAVRSGIALYRTNDMLEKGGMGSYPASLENGSGCCFTTVLIEPVPGWNKQGSNAYTHEATKTMFTYDRAKGTFAKKE